MRAVCRDNSGKENEVVIRKTRSVCPLCCQEVAAMIVSQGQAIIMKKQCPVHGNVSSIITSNNAYFHDLSDAYFTIVPKGMPLKILELSLTPHCSMNCPICSVMDSVGKRTHGLTKEDIKKIIKLHPDKEIILWGMEPTENKHLEEILRCLKKNKKQPFLFTNGQKIANFNYLKKLKEAGLAHVYLQFDGFDDATYEILRRERLLKNKMRAFENLKKLKIPTTLNVTLAKGINESQINKIIDYSIENCDFIRQIGFLPLIKVGKADSYRDDVVPELHEFLKIIERETKGAINLRDLRAFQKLMYVIYRFARFRRCFWFTLYILVKKRKGSGYKTIAEVIDLSAIESIIDGYISNLKRGARVFGGVKVCIQLLPHLVNFRTLPFVIGALKFFLLGKRLEDARSLMGMVFITCTDFCDFYKMDLDMSDNYCEELLALKDKIGNIIYEPTYKMMIEGSRNDAYRDYHCCAAKEKS